MSILTTLASGALAYISFEALPVLNHTDTTAEMLNDFPWRKTAYKIGALAIKGGFLGIALTSLATCLGSMYSLANGTAVFAASSLFMQTIVGAGIASIGLIALAIPLTLSARLWEVS